MVRTSDAGVSGKNLLQIAAIFGMIGVWAIIVHKAYGVVSMLALKHSGVEFWLALARHLMANLAGG
jgi:apolipoprotein N-acyltransferase